MIINYQLFIKIKEMHDGLSSNTEWVRSDIPEPVKVSKCFTWSFSLSHFCRGSDQVK